jgi:phage FluMu protein Com
MTFCCFRVSLRQINWPLEVEVMAHIIIRCPRTGSKVQVWLSEPTSADKPDSYEDVKCPACLRLHFVNKITGELLGEKVASEGLNPAP